MSDAERRTLTHVGGETRIFGAPAFGEKLAAALDVPRSDQTRARGAQRPRPQEGYGAEDLYFDEPQRRAPSSGEDDPARPHVHGFHAWPARMHPMTARALIERFSAPGGRVLDPFAGSGTVAIEAMLAGRHAFANDLNPLAVRLLAGKTDRKTDFAAVLEDAEKIRNFADERRIKKVGASRRYEEDDVALFSPHVLLALDSIRLGIETIAREETFRPLFLVLSAMLVKFSKRGGDSADGTVEKRFPPDFPARFFLAKTEEFARRLEAFRELVPADSRLFTYEEDASQLSKIRDAEIDLLVTSPPYAATYDYFEHHALRLRWLGLDGRSFSRGEMGARRSYQRLGPGETAARWADELRGMLQGFARVLKPGGHAILVVGDSASRQQVLRADEFVARATEETPFRVVARASQDRPHFHLPTAHLFETRPRAEHAILLERDASAPVRIAPRAGGVFRNPEPQRRFETNDAPRASEARSDGEQRPRFQGPRPQGPRSPANFPSRETAGRQGQGPVRSRPPANSMTEASRETAGPQGQGRPSTPRERPRNDAPPPRNRRPR